jgi:hypothetical protein
MSSSSSPSNASDLQEILRLARAALTQDEFAEFIAKLTAQQDREAAA